VALARALDAAGHEAVVCGPHRFEDFVVGHGIRFAGVDDGPMRQLDSPAEAGNVIQGGVRARLRQVRSMPGMFNQVLADCWRVASAGAGAGAQAIVHNGQILAGQHLGEALGVPAVLGLPIPMYVPTAAFPWAGQALPRWWPARLNRASYGGMKMPAVMFGRVIDQWRSDTLRLKPRPGRHDPTRNPDGTAAVVLHAYSPAVLPRPDDWPSAALVTGYWFLDDNSTLPADVQQFLADGPAPVFAGFGSMTGLDPVQTATAVVDAAAIAEARLILATGWGGLDTEGAKAAAGRTGVDLCVVDNVDYRGLFRGCPPWCITAGRHHRHRIRPTDRRWCARLSLISRSSRIARSAGWHTTAAAIADVGGVGRTPDGGPRRGSPGRRSGSRRPDCRRRRPRRRSGGD
jgi:sterol 3beta-glucosyltransferase